MIIFDELREIERSERMRGREIIVFDDSELGEPSPYAQPEL
jgi:hypothetical protein